jgi:pimeloyl-ACP methyl ester carboxylesterase
MKWFFVIVIILIGVYTIVAVYAGYMLSTQRFPKPYVNPKLISENYNDVSFQTNDGLTLKGWLFPKGKNVVILVHGLTQNRYDEGYFFIPLIRDLLNQDYSVLTFDLRAHGESDGKSTYFGAKEGADVLAAIQFAKSKGYKEESIAIVANSTGAIATILLGKDLAGVSAIVVDSIPSNFGPVIIRRLWVEKHLPTFISPSAFFFAKKFSGLDLEKLKPIDKISEIDEPILFLHAEKDDVFFLEDAKKVAIIRSESKFVTFKGAEHIHTYRSDPDLWKNEVFGFLKDNLRD